MTVIKPNAIAGINSITVASGAALAIHKADGTLIQTLSGAAGVSTFTSISVGSAATSNSAAKSINIGLGASISQHTDNSLSFGTGGDERARIDSSGRLMVGHNSSLAIGGGDNAPLQVSATSSVVFGGARYVNSSSGPFISLSKSRATTAGSNTIVQDGDDLGTLLFSGDDGTDLISKGAQIQAQVDGTPGSNDMPGRLLFYTTADGAASPTERLRITSVGIATFTEIGTGNGMGGVVASTASGGGNAGFQWATNSKGRYQVTTIGSADSESLRVYDIQNAAERLRVDNSGRVLLGTTTEGHSNADDLTIATSANTGITIRSGTSNGGNIFFSDATSGTGEYAGMVSYDHNDNIMTFHTTDGSERIRIGSAGQIGIAGANYGSSGQVLTSGGSGSAVQWATASAGIEMAQHFRLTSSSQGNQSPLTNWEAADNSFAGSLGSSMSVSSGVFTYPSTGIYFCLFTLVGYSDSSTQNLIGFIEQTIDGGSNWGNVAYGLNGIYDFSNSYPSWANTATHYIFDVTDTSQQKTRFGYGAGQGPEYVKGDTNITYTGVTFIRLGDT